MVDVKVSDCEEEVEKVVSLNESQRKLQWNKLQVTRDEVTSFKYIEPVLSEILKFRYRREIHFEKIPHSTVE